MPALSDMLVFSHLGWNFVYQRPQHVISRLAKDWRIFFIEEPVQDGTADSHWEYERVADRITVCRPHTGITGRGFTPEQASAVAAAMPELLGEFNIGEYAAWTYTPMALPIIESLSPRLFAYDCMDELSKFLNAPKELIELERRTLEACDVVFTGGRSLYRAKKDRHPNVHCFPSSVDAEHFGKAKLDVPEAEDQRPLPHPRLGYFGVIDERIDLPLIAAIADSHPDWQMCLVGPVVKIDPATLPKRPNIHWFGQRHYAELPNFLRGWDVCLLPFALNDATQFISPTKTLEYMAAERPIVSTPITDVVDCYSHIVRLGKTADEFVAACEAAPNETPEEKAARKNAIDEVLTNTTWDLTVAGMQRELERTLEAKQQQIPQADQANGENEREFSQAVVPVNRLRARQQWPTIIIGAGPTGLSAAFHLRDALLLEQGESVGGWCRSLQSNGFTFDFAGHIMFSNEPYVHEMYDLLLKDNVHWQDREAWIYSHGVYTRYPFQGALYGLPPDVIKECIVGAIEARFGSISAATQKSPSTNGSNGAIGANGANGTNGSLHASAKTNGAALHRIAVIGTNGQLHAAGSSVKDCCGDGVLESTCKLSNGTASNGSVSNGSAASGSAHNSTAAENFEQFIYRVWGAGIAKHFAIPYNHKLWAVPLAEMETSWLGGRVPMPDLGEMIEGALQPVAKPMGPNARFGYPLRGGFQSLMDGFLPYVQDRLRLNSKVVRVSLKRREIELADGGVFAFEQLISTMPLPLLVKAIGDEAPEYIHEAASKLRHVSVRCVHLGIGREQVTEKHWIYYPEQTVFHRIFVQGNASPFCNPPGGFGLTCEITYSEHKPLPCDGVALIQRCIEDCRSVGIIGVDDPIWAATQVDLSYAYVVYDHARRENVRLIRDWLAGHGVLLAGRYSEWEYYNSDHAFIAGKRAADAAAAAGASRTTESAAVTT